MPGLPALLDYQVSSGILLSNAWTWCQFAGGFCINSANEGTEKIVSLLQAADRKLNDEHVIRALLPKSDGTALRERRG